MNSDLSKALQAAFTGSANLSTNFPKLWVGKAHTKTALPILVLTEVSDVAGYYTGASSDYVERIVIQFTAYASDTGNVAAGDFLLATADDLEAAYNRKALPLTTDMLLLCRKATGGTPYPEDDKAWRIDVTYEITVQRNV